VLAQKKAYVANLEELFVEGDLDEDGFITYEEFAEQMKDERVEAYMRSLKIDTSNIKALFEELDSDGSGEIEVYEFVDSLLHMMRAQSVEQIVHQCKGETRRVSRFLDSVSDQLADMIELMEMHFQREESMIEKASLGRVSRGSRSENFEGRFSRGISPRDENFDDQETAPNEHEAVHNEQSCAHLSSDGASSPSNRWRTEEGSEWIGDSTGYAFFAHRLTL